MTNIFERGSVFESLKNESYPYQFDAALHLDMVLGGVPSDPRVAEGWLRTKIQDTDQRIQEMVAKTMVERGITDADEALRIVNDLRNLNGFKRGGPEHPGHEGELYLEGRQLKAALKEAVSVAVGANKLVQKGWGQTRKFLTNYLPEHVFVPNRQLWLRQVERDGDDNPQLGLPFKEPTGVLQQFVHTHRGSSIQYQEYVVDAIVEFEVISDHNFSDRDWGLIWTTGENQGLGASRSQTYGTYQVIKWERRQLSGKRGATS